MKAHKISIAYRDQKITLHLTAEAVQRLARKEEPMDSVRSDLDRAADNVPTFYFSESQARRVKAFINAHGIETITMYI